MNHHHNTTNESGTTLDRMESKAATQDEMVLALFQKHPMMNFTPSEVHAAVLPGAPQTSARRAITNLTTRGLLRKTDQKYMGPYGRPEFAWTLNDKPT